MKKIVAVLLLAALLLPSFAMAAGKLSVVQENFTVSQIYGIYAHTFAKVENTGDKPVKLASALIEVFDKNGDALDSKTYIHLYPEVLNPGEYGYAWSQISLDSIKGADEVGDHALTISGKTDNNSKVHRLPLETSYMPDTKVSAYSTRNLMSAVITNDTEETLFDIKTALVLLDEDDNILSIGDVELYDSVGLAPGSTMTVRAEFSESLKAAADALGLKPAKVDAIAFVEIKE